MSDQVMPTSSAGSGEQPARVRPEGLGAVPAVETGANAGPAGPEAAPTLGGSPASASASQPAAAPARLSPDDVAAAIAAVPGGPPPIASGGAVQMPSTAADVDVIEPEWVDKAEDVVKTHQGDPYGEEEGIEELQVDYLQKRYGIGVKGPDNAKGGTASKPKGA